MCERGILGCEDAGSRETTCCWVSKHGNLGNSRACILLGQAPNAVVLWQPVRKVGAGMRWGISPTLPSVASTQSCPGAKQADLMTSLHHAWWPFWQRVGLSISGGEAGSPKWSGRARRELAPLTAGLGPNWCVQGDVREFLEWITFYNDKWEHYTVRVGVSVSGGGGYQLPENIFLSSCWVFFLLGPLRYHIPFVFHPFPD